MTRLLSLLAFLLIAALPTFAGAVALEKPLTEHRLGKADAPIRVDEYVSLTCSHCAEFYNNELPELEKKYVDTGKVMFVMHHYPLDGISLKAAALAECMPEDQYFPFVKTLYSSLKAWAFDSGNPDKALVQYSRLAGLTEEKAKTCLNDEKVQNAIIKAREAASYTVKIQATPTFVINNGAEIVQGSRKAADFAAIFDRLLAAKK